MSEIESCPTCGALPIDQVETIAKPRPERTLTLYRDDSTSQVAYDRVKTWFWTAGNTVLVISRYDTDEGGAHHYIHWPRERFCWFRDEPSKAKEGHHHG